MQQHMRKLEVHEGGLRRRKEELLALLGDDAATLDAAQSSEDEGEVVRGVWLPTPRAKSLVSLRHGAITPATPREHASAAKPGYVDVFSASGSKLSRQSSRMSATYLLGNSDEEDGDLSAV